MVWVDVSATPFLVKVYRGGVWDIARGASTDRVTAPPASASDYQTPSAASASSEVVHEYAAGSVGQGVNHLSWFAHWKVAFYAYGYIWVLWQPNVGSGQLNIARSADLVNWLQFPSIDTVADTILWDSWFDGTYLHLCYVWYDGSSTYYLCYRRCTPSQEGLAVGARYQIYGYTSSGFASPPRICVDEQGYAWIAVRATIGFPYGQGVYVFKNARNDGGWETASGYPTYLWLGASAQTASIGSVGSGGRMIAVCGDPNVSPPKLRARHYNGSSWENSVDLANLYTSPDYWFTTPILGPDGLVHLLFGEYSTGNVHHITYNPSSNSWTTPANLGFTGQYGFSLFRDHRGILAAYITGVSTINIRRYVDGIWLQPIQYQHGWMAYQHSHLYQASPGEKAALLWLYASSAPYPLLAATFKQMYPAKDSIDDIASTGWRPSTPQGSYITFDLGSTLAGVAGCRILWPDDATLRPQAYRIQASEDNTNWTTLATYTSDPGAGWREYAWLPLNRCRYIRIAIDTPGTSGVMLQEFDYYQSSIWRHGHRGD